MIYPGDWYRSHESVKRSTKPDLGTVRIQDRDDLMNLEIISEPVRADQKTQELSVLMKFSKTIGLTLRPYCYGRVEGW